MIDKDIQLAWLERQKERINDLKKDLKALTESPYFGNDVWGINQEKISDIEFNVIYSKPKVHWYNWHYKKTIEIKLTTDIVINSIKENLEKELKKEEALYNNSTDKDFQKENCFNYRDWYKNEKELYPGCRNCNKGYCCTQHFDFKRELKKEILGRVDDSILR